MIKQHIFMQNLTHRLTLTLRTTHAEEDGEAWNELRCELWLAFPCTDLWGPHLTMSSAEWRINKGIQKRHTHTHTHTSYLHMPSQTLQGILPNSHECQQYIYRLGWQLTHWPPDRHWCQGRKSHNAAEFPKEFTVVQVYKMVSSHGRSESSGHVLHNQSLFEGFISILAISYC